MNNHSYFGLCWASKGRCGVKAVRFEALDGIFP